MRTLRYALIIPSIFLITAAQSYAGTDPEKKPETITLPCVPNFKPGFMRSCTELIPKVIGAIQKNLENKLMCFNDEKDIDIFTPPQAGSPSDLGNASFSKTSCADYASKPFDKFCNLSTGEEKNPLPARGASYSCGKPSQLINGKFYAHSSVGTKPEDALGTLESRYIQGAYVQALLSCRERLVDEITSGKKFLALSCPTGDFKKLEGAFSLLIKRLGDATDLTENESVEKHCAENSDYDKMMGDPEKLKHQMAVCYLSAARTRIEAMVSYLANCELYSRWSKWWYLNLGQFKTVQHQLIKDCADVAAKSTAQKKFGCCGYTVKGIDVCPSILCFESMDTPKYEDNFNKCYRDKIHSYFKTKMDSLIPNSKDGCKF